MATIIFDRDHALGDWTGWPREEPMLNPGIVSLLKLLKSDGHTNVLATNGSETKIEETFESTGLYDLFDYCFGSESVSYGCLVRGEKVKDLRKLEEKLPSGSLDDAVMIGNYDDAFGCTSKIPLIEVHCNKLNQSYWNIDKVYSLVNELINPIKESPSQNFDRLFKSTSDEIKRKEWSWRLFFDPDISEIATIKLGGFSY